MAEFHKADYGDLNHHSNEQSMSNLALTMADYHIERAKASTGRSKDFHVSAAASYHNLMTSSADNSYRRVTSKSSSVQMPKGLHRYNRGNN